MYATQSTHWYRRIRHELDLLQGTIRKCPMFHHRNRFDTGSLERHPSSPTLGVVDGVAPEVQLRDDRDGVKTYDKMHVDADHHDIHYEPAPLVIRTLP